MCAVRGVCMCCEGSVCSTCLQLCPYTAIYCNHSSPDRAHTCTNFDHICNSATGCSEYPVLGCLSPFSQTSTKENVLCSRWSFSEGNVCAVPRVWLRCGSVVRYTDMQLGREAKRRGLHCHCIILQPDYVALLTLHSL